MKECVQAAEGALKVLLVRPKFSSIVANLEPLGLEYISSLLNDVGFKNEIFDEFQHPRQFRFPRLARKIKRGGFDCVGFNANANTTDYIIQTSAHLKQRFPDLYIMVGGPEAELNYRDFFTDSIDFVYHDNGLTSLKNAFESRFAPDILAEQDGVCFKREGTWVVKEKGAPACGFLTQPDRSSLYANIRKNFIFRKG
ncbi:MAG: cobalamin B12-binding domain-containing protein, partial [Coriobacteriia bacterium]|nr:cobalamin B12-binding domain-containing protein [Coriobacteriia bacterium]